MKICSKTHEIAPFKKKICGEAYASEHPKQTFGYTPRVASRFTAYATRPALQKSWAPLDKSCIRPWTTTKKFIRGDALVESTLADS